MNNQSNKVKQEIKDILLSENIKVREIIESNNKPTHILDGLSLIIHNDYQNNDLKKEELKKEIEFLEFEINRAKS